MTEDEAKAMMTKGLLITTGYGGGIGEWAVACFIKSAVVSVDMASTLPTDAEVALIRGYTEFIARGLYKPHAIEEILRKGVEGHNTLILVKGPDWRSNGENGWAYRRKSWTQGPTFYPWMETKKPAPPWNLVQVMDHIQNMVPKKWKAWKAEHSTLPILAA